MRVLLSQCLLDWLHQKVWNCIPYSLLSILRTRWRLGNTVAELYFIASGSVRSGALHSLIRYPGLTNSIVYYPFPIIFYFCYSCYYYFIIFYSCYLFWKWQTHILRYLTSLLGDNERSHKILQNLAQIHRSANHSTATFVEVSLNSFKLSFTLTVLVWPTQDTYSWWTFRVCGMRRWM
jgi:hypothetical protein